MQIKDFVKLTSYGLEIAEFTDIRSALIDRYKEIYGTDIDLSTATADGVFVNDLSLIINNILQVMNGLYANLDVNQAEGIYLDTLCALSNVTRKQPTYSNAIVTVTNIGNTALNNLENLVFIDKAGNEWVHEGTESFAIDESKNLQVTCTTIGEIQAPAGWIDKTLELLTLSVTQSNPANVGSNIESDDALRARRNQSSGANGITVLQSLAGALLNVSGISDVKIYNNNTGEEITATDTTDIPEHNIYVIIRQNAGITIDESVIGNIIHEKLTPGISTTESTALATNGVSKSYTYVERLYDMTIAESNQIVYWKEAVGIAPQIQITIIPKQFFTTDEFEEIGDSLISYLNNLPISTGLNSTNILIETVNADPTFRSNPTYSVGTITLSSSTNPDTFFHYTSATFAASGANYILTLA